MSRSAEADAYVAVGSNIEPRRNIPRAMELLGRRERISGVSTFYETTAIGPPGQPAFVNGVWRLRTATPPERLKYDVLRDVEARLGRQRTGDTYTPRTIDLDIVLWGRAVIDRPDLQVPSRDLGRPFVALPLMELAGDMDLPAGLGRLGEWCSTMTLADAREDAELTRRLREMVT